MAELWHLLAVQEEEYIVDVPEPQIVIETVDVIVTTLKERISERAFEQLVEASDEPVPRFQEEIAEVIHFPRSRPRSVRRSSTFQCLRCWKSSKSASRSVRTNRSSMCQCLRLSTNQGTKHAEIPQTHNVDKFVDPSAGLQRQVPQIHGVLKTEKVPLAQFVGSVVDMPVIMQIMPLMQRQVPQIQTY